MRSASANHGFLLFALTLSLIAASAASLHATRARVQTPDLGIDVSLHGKQIFPSSNPWNTDISAMPVDPNSANLIASMGLTSPLHPDFGTTYQGSPIGMDYV